MTLSIAIVVVLVLLAIALLPVKRRDGEARDSPLSLPLPTFSQGLNLREQQLQEESDAIVSEYRKRADELWREEVREKAATLLGSTK